MIYLNKIKGNHCRAVAAICNKLNLKSHLFLRSHTNKPHELKLSGNLLIDRLTDSNIYLIESSAQYKLNIEYKMKIIAKKLENKYSQNSYIIPIGGSNTMV
jgi:1-aminocyclopropane-1-carboxylate deaminase/D-cysteine desulfhydrase-like pyridoxal-dependent ACC family enzyme